MSAPLPSTLTMSPKPSPSSPASHYQLVAEAIRYLRERRSEQPSLGDLAAALGTSESHLQRVFSTWAGVSPKRFLKYLTHRHAVDALQKQATVLEASLHAGLSGPGRLHDLTISCQAMTPGEIAGRGKGLALQCGWGLSPFGAAFVLWNDRGICELSLHNDRQEQVFERAVQEWSGARVTTNDDAAAMLINEIFQRPLERGRLHLLLRGTNFQIKVWEALLRVGPGELVSYQQLAAAAGSPSASRAVGSAMARNRIAYLIPCHRVIRQTGDFGSYRWGIERKLAMHGWESKG